MSEFWRLPSLLEAAPADRAEALPLFRKIAGQILSETTLRVAGAPCRIREVEFYLHAQGHPDSFTHCAPQQKSQGRWRLHRQGSGYRGGSFKGLDLTFGPPSVFGGVLIRSLSLPDGQFINGSALCVNHVLSQTGCETVASLDQMIGGESVFGSNPLRLEHASDSFNAPIWETPRVGLSLRRVDAGSEQMSYFAQPYRFLNAPREIKKGRSQLVVAMHIQGISETEIHATVGSPLRAISAWITAYKQEACA
jgi:hypothetical protein